MSSTSHLFSNLFFSESLPSVTLANGSTTAISGIGTIQPNPSFSLSSISNIPKFPFNLMSISKLTKHLNCSVTFFPGSVVIQDLKTETMIGEGCESNGLYYLKECASSTACSISISPLQIHCRLGHPSLEKLKILIPSLSHVSSLECESYQLGKHHHVHFPTRVNGRASAPFLLVHSNIWGPSCVASKLGFRYFVTFVGDYLMVTWLYLMKDRPELFSIFPSFWAKVQTEFNVPIRILRSDNAREYFSTTFNTFMADLVLFTNLLVLTPQQNEVVERKNMYLLEITRCLLFQMNVPKSFWAYAIFTTCYLISKMPSFVLDSKSPHSILFPQECLFQLPPCIFGCVCFGH